jgi:hypothetical protein
MLTRHTSKSLSTAGMVAIMRSLLLLVASLILLDFAHGGKFGKNSVYRKKFSQR